MLNCVLSRRSTLRILTLISPKPPSLNPRPFLNPNPTFPHHLLRRFSSTTNDDGRDTSSDVWRLSPDSNRSIDSIFGPDDCDGGVEDGEAGGGWGTEEKRDYDVFERVDVKLIKIPTYFRSNYSAVTAVQRSSKMCYSTDSVNFGKDYDNNENNNASAEIDDADFLPDKRELFPQTVDPRRGWGFRGVHRAIICGKVGQAPLQKILRNGRTVTIFTVGTGGMFDQRLIGTNDLPKPAQWHRIAVHNEELGAYSIQQLVKNSPVYVEGDIETRVYNDNINGEVKNVPEICVRYDGKIRLVKMGGVINKISFEELREGLL